MYFLRKGFQVYVVDLPPNGRSNFLTGSHMNLRDTTKQYKTMDAAFVEQELTAPEVDPNDRKRHANRYPTAKYHDKWPGVSVASLNMHRCNEPKLTQLRPAFEVTPSLPTIVPLW